MRGELRIVHLLPVCLYAQILSAAGKIINEDSMGKMFDMDKDYGCGWYIDPHLKNAYVHTGGTPNFAAINICFTDTEFGNLYFIELKPTVEGGDIDAQIVGHIEEGPRSLTIQSEYGTFNY